MPKLIEIYSENNALPECLAQKLITTKDALMLDVEERAKDILESLANSSRHTTRYYNVMEKLLDSFIDRVRKTILPGNLEDWWGYSYSISYRGIVLFLNHLSGALINEDGTDVNCQYVDQSFPLASIRARMLSVDEYAKLYDLQQVTVRQWIRRGKLRTVEKVGNSWLISELTDVPKHGFEPAIYRWDDELSDLPEGFEYINGYRLARFMKGDSADTIQVFLNAIVGNRPQKKTIALTAAERERLEAFFIANPDVSYTSKSYSFHWKKQPGEIVRRLDEEVEG